MSAITSTFGMFWTAADFNQDLSKWEVSAVTDMSFMFARACAFNQDLSKREVSAVTNMHGMAHAKHNDDL